ncbi:Uncharacterized protein APZ42_030201 [Daphnia magna]|uniref:HTH CENPB-type domain-containing protein n=1 Tax=Daphnia magna TaxID=35525 RepID=A0A164NZ69_9CRUS|nr:Uncharacterized protein APZ42_030201 [Daphnia magna]
MTRTYIRKNGGTAPTESAIKEALLQQHSKGISFRKAAQQRISKSTLHRLSKQFDPTDPNTSTLKQSFHNRQVLTPEQEEELSQYLIVAQKLNHGLTPLDTKKLAYCYGKANQISMPNQWSVKKAAGSDWFSLFLKRNKNLSIRKPERTSQARAAAVNHRVIDKFYDDLFELINKHNFQPEDIFNCDETNNPTVVEPQKIFAKTGVKAVGQILFQQPQVKNKEQM